MERRRAIEAYGNQEASKLLTLHATRFASLPAAQFGFEDYDIMLSTQPDKSVGGDDIWGLATAALEGALKRKGWNYGVDEGGGAFYGPKIDLKIRDAIGRTWQCSTVQCDFNLPER